MTHNPDQTRIYHITDVANLPAILAAGGLHSDATMAHRQTAVIGYEHIKLRRLTEIQVACCGGRFVGSFVPFYFCPRSPMLYTINRGNTGRPPGCQRSIVHLVSTVGAALAQNRLWAISDGNAGTRHATFSSNVSSLAGLDWSAIRATQWQGRVHEKQAEFLLADFFYWSGIQAIGCYNEEVAQQVREMLMPHAHRPTVSAEPSWYY